MSPRWYSSGFDLDQTPSCLTGEAPELPCSECPYWDRSPCPIESDPEYRSFVSWTAERQQGFRRRSAEQVSELKVALGAHGLPLHWEVLAAIAMARRPDLFPSPRSVLRLMTWHPDEFEPAGNGVYRLAEYQAPIDTY